MTLAQAVREMMNVRDMGPAEVEYQSERLGDKIHKATVYRILDGSRTPQLNTFLMLCKVLRIAPSEMLQRAGLDGLPFKPVDFRDMMRDELPEAVAETAIQLVDVFLQSPCGPKGTGISITRNAPDTGGSEDTARPSAKCIYHNSKPNRLGLPSFDSPPVTYLA